MQGSLRVSLVAFSTGQELWSDLETSAQHVVSTLLKIPMGKYLICVGHWDESAKNLTPLHVTPSITTLRVLLCPLLAQMSFETFATTGWFLDSVSRSFDFFLDLIIASSPLLLRSFVTAITCSAEGSSGDSKGGSLETTSVLNVVFSDDWKKRWTKSSEPTF